MKKQLEKIVNLFLVLLTLFNTVATPLTVLADTLTVPDIPNKGDIKLEENGVITQYGTEVGDYVTTTGGSLTNQGDVQIIKKVTKKNDIGLYTVEITVNGVDYKDEQKTPIYTIFVLDASYSMRGTPWNNAKTAAINFSNTLVNNYDENKIALITFSNRTMVNRDYNYFVNSSNKTRAFINIDFDSTSNGTNYYKGLEPAYNMVSDIKDIDKNAIINVIFISDGDPTNVNCTTNCSYNEIRGGDYANLIKDEDATLYTLAYNLSTTSEAYNLLKNMSSSGEVISTTSSDIDSKLQAIATKITKTPAASNAVVTDKIGTDFTFVDSDSNTSGITVNDGEVAYNIGKIEEGKTYTFQFDIQIDTNTTNDWTFTNDVSNIKVTENGKVLASIEQSAEVYWEANKYDYIVKYYYDGEYDETKDENGNVTYGTSITNYTDKNKPGYKLEKVTTADSDSLMPLIVSDNVSNNIINVYYVKDNFNYTIEYYYNGEIDNSLTENKEALYQSEITEYTNKLKEGYKFDKVETSEDDKTLPLTIDTDLSKNIIKVYYITDENQTKELKYTVEYYKDGVLQENDTQIEETTVQFLEPDTLTVDKTKINITDKYFGYKFEKIDPTTIPDIIENNGVIKVYYITDEKQTKDLKYTVEYYKDGVLQENDTQIETIRVQVLQDDIMSVDKTKINIIDKYVGYKFQNTDPIVLPDNINNNGIIKVYYVKDTFNYTIQYYYDNVIDNAKTETGTALFESNIETYTDKNIPGYKLEKVETTELNNNTLPLTISSNSDNNIIKVYYVKDDYGYKVEYYYDGKFDDSKTYTSKAEYMSEVTTYPEQNKKGYSFQKTENFPLTIESETTKNIIKVYYVSNIYDYTIKHVEKGNEENILDIEKGSANFEEEIKVNSKEFIGFTYDSQDKETIVIDVENNTATVYYTRNVYSYTVEYYKENLDGEFEIANDDTIIYENVLFESETTYIINEYEGYTYDDTKTENSGSLVPANNNLVIRLYYTLDESKVIVHYVVKVEDNYIPFDKYGRDEFGNNTPDFVGVELENDILFGKIGSNFTTKYRELPEYTLLGIYDGNILENHNLSKLSGIEITSNFELQTKEYTYIYEAPIGDTEENPPQTGFEGNSSYMEYILLIALICILKKYFKLIKDEKQEN